MLYHPDQHTNIGQAETIDLRLRHRKFLTAIQKMLKEKDIRQRLLDQGLKTTFLFGSVSKNQDIFITTASGDIKSDIDLYIELNAIDTNKDFLQRSLEVKKYLEEIFQSLVKEYDIDLHISHYPSDTRNLFNKHTRVIWTNTIS